MAGSANTKPYGCGGFSFAVPTINVNKPFFQIQSPLSLGFASFSIHSITQERDRRLIFKRIYNSPLALPETQRYYKLNF